MLGSNWKWPIFEGRKSNVNSEWESSMQMRKWEWTRLILSHISHIIDTHVSKRLHKIHTRVRRYKLTHTHIHIHACMYRIKEREREKLSSRKMHKIYAYIARRFPFDRYRSSCRALFIAQNNLWICTGGGKRKRWRFALANVHKRRFRQRYWGKLSCAYAYHLHGSIHMRKYNNTQARYSVGQYKIQVPEAIFSYIILRKIHWKSYPVKRTIFRL